MSTITGEYVFNLAGSTMSLGRAAAVGRLTANGSGGVFSRGVMDMNQAGTISADAIFTGTYTVPASASIGLLTATMNITLDGTPVKLNHNFYLQMIIQNEAILVIITNDASNGTKPML